MTTLQMVRRAKYVQAGTALINDLAHKLAGLDSTTDGIALWESRSPPNWPAFSSIRAMSFPTWIGGTCSHARADGTRCGVSARVFGRGEHAHPRHRLGGRHRHRASARRYGHPAAERLHRRHRRRARPCRSATIRVHAGRDSRIRKAALRGRLLRHCLLLVRHRARDGPEKRSLERAVGQEPSGDGRRRAKKHSRRRSAAWAKTYFVQTPNKWFPIESHTWLPFVGFVPRAAQLATIAVSNRFWIKRTSPDWHLLTAREMRTLFPDAEIRRERFLGPYEVDHGDPSLGRDIAFQYGDERVEVPGAIALQRERSRALGQRFSRALRSAASRSSSARSFSKLPAR